MATNRSQHGKILPASALALIIALAVLSQAPGAQLGEVAGYLNYVIQVGHSQTLTLTLVNGGNQTLGVMMQPPGHLTLISPAGTDANQILPTITSIVPMNLTIPPHSFAHVNITIYMPLNNTPRQAAWEGIMSAQMVSNQSNSGGGAVILSGVAKVFTIASIPSTTTTTISTTTMPSALQTLGSPTALVGGLVGVAAVVILYYMTKGKKKGKGGKGAAKPKRKGARRTKKPAKRARRRRRR